MRKNARKVEFNVDAYTARLIGRENVSKLEGAVLEIVKNAYDADAKIFCLYYSQEKNCIYIMDNGIGMEENIIRTHWMTIGNSSKKNNFISKGNRIQTGAKGIGRFALDRISDKCRMLTISEKGGLEWIVNWEDFSGTKKISEVTAELYDTNAALLEYAEISNWKNSALAKIIKENEFDSTGTVFCLEELRDVWDKKTMERLRNHLENLLPPDVVKDFRILFFDDTTSAQEADVISSNVDSYDYKIEFQVEDDSLNIQIHRNEFDFRGEDESVFKEAGFDEEEQRYFYGDLKKLVFSMKSALGKANCIGDYNGVLYFNKIMQSEKDKQKFYYKDFVGRANLTKQFGGIKLYRDNFRVRPYGEYGDNDFDWLELSARGGRSPAGLGHPKGQWRVGAEQILGSVYISRNNTNLDDDANRNGIQEGIGLWQLKQVLLFVINEFERDRQFVGRKLADYAKQKDELEKRKEEIRRLAEYQKQMEASLKKREKEPEVAEHGNKEPKKEKLPQTHYVNPVEVAELLDAMEQQQQELQELRDENKMLQTLATTGIVTNKFMHEIRTLTNNIGQELDAAYEALKYDQDIEYALKNVVRAVAFKKNFASWFGVTIEAVKKDKRFRKKLNLKKALDDFITNWKDILKKNNVNLEFECEEDIEFYCFGFDLENIISNLISNSLNSFDREMDEVLEKKDIKLSITASEGGFMLDYEDTGWGLIEKYKARPELILEAFESGHAENGEEEGTGMGMWIINITVSEYHGSIDLTRNRTEKQGFYVTIKMGGSNV